MTPTEVAYLTHWLMTASAGFFFLLCALAIDFFILRRERKHSRQR